MMTKDRLIGLLFLLFCALVWFHLIPAYVKGTDQSVYPRLITFCLALPALGMLLRKGGEPMSFKLSTLSLEALKESVYSRTAILMLSYMLYLYCINKIGFFMSSAFFCIFYLLFFGERSALRILLTPAFLLGTVYFAIVYTLKFPLPRGILF